MSIAAAPSCPAATPGPGRAALTGLCATLIGIGLARFAYTPLIPVLIGAGWFTAPQAAYLGAANLAGYLAGSLLARPMAARAPAALVLRAMMLLATAALFACAVRGSFGWFVAWRLGAGVAGGAIMVLAAPTVLPHVPPSRRGLVGGAIFTGVGVGIAASGTLVPVLLGQGLVATWCGLGALSAILTAIAWHGWPQAAPADLPARRLGPIVRPVDHRPPGDRERGANAPVGRSQPAELTDTPPCAGAAGTRTLIPEPRGPRWRTAARAPAPGSARGSLARHALLLEYGLNAVGLVPHMVFLVDFVARELGRGIAAGSRYWIAYGVGAVLGPMIAGRAADRFGFPRALRSAFALQAVAVALPALSSGPAALLASSVVMGAFTPGIVPLVLGRAHELVEPDPAAQRAIWSHATTAFALGQAAGAYGFSYLFSRAAGSYALLFDGAAAVLVVALALDLAAGGRRGPWRIT
jgi:predicted MFS family arabinose efflux permease